VDLDVPADQHLNSDYQIRISDADDAMAFADSQEFGVGTCPPVVCFQMKYPFDDVRKITAIQGKPFPVTWSKCALEATAVKIELWYLDQVETVLADSAPNTGYFVWEVPADQHLNSDYRIVVVDAAEKRHKAATTEFSVARDTVPADLDFDGDVDLADFQTFQGCFNGPNRPTACSW